MANLLLDVIAYLKAQNIVTGDGQDCFRDNLPPSPDNVVAIFEYADGGTQPGVVCFDRYLQIQTRNLSYHQAREKAYEIYNALNTPEDPIKHLTSTRKAVINGKSSPKKLLQDQNERTVFVSEIVVTTLTD